MKYLLTFAMILLCAYSASAQDVNAFPTISYYADSLSSTHDTVDVSFRSDLDFESYQVTAWSTSADTLIVSIESDNAAKFVQHGVVSLASGTKSTSMITGTTPVDFIILAAKDPRKLRFTSTALPNTIFFVVSGKQELPVY